MELHPYRLDHGLTDVSQLDAADRPRLPAGPASLLPTTSPASGPLQRLFREQGLDVYLTAALGGPSAASGNADAASASAFASAPLVDAQSFTTPRGYGQALDQACVLLEQKLAARGDPGDASTKIMRSALRVLTSTAEMRAELAMLRGLLLAG
ncbi:hypothetical protein [Robbsia sp. KACC 23696]|uniref:hypothetical protein n=1 Tax=Robbsia sp. KACC 23696 TaxID=3149231 RepID=UPI00325B163F